MTKSDKLHDLADRIWDIAKRKENDHDLDQAVTAIKELSSALHALAYADDLKIYIQTSYKFGGY